MRLPATEYVASLAMVLGLLVAHWGSRLLVTQFATVALDVGVDWRVVVFAGALAVGTALLFGTIPLIRATTVDPIEALKSGPRVGSAALGVQSAILVTQLALSATVVILGALFIRSFWMLANVPVGADVDHVLLVRLDPQRSRVEPTGRANLYERYREAAASAPGVENAGVSFTTPLGGLVWTSGIEVNESRQFLLADRTVLLNWISPQWFATMGIPIIAGRDFTRMDRSGSAPVAIVNETFVRRLLPNSRNVLGRTITRVAFDDTKHPAQIVGVVGDVLYQSLRDPSPPTMYLSQMQAEVDSLPLYASVVVRPSTGHPATLIPSLGAALGSIDPAVTLNLAPMAHYIDPHVVRERTLATLSEFFGGLAALLTGIGVFGVMTYSVHRRRQELGIRLALGASPASVQAMVLGRALLLAALGATCGVFVSLWASTMIAPLLFGVHARDAIVFAGSAVMLLCVGLSAAWLPARNAAMIDPAVTLREQ